MTRVACAVVLVLACLSVAGGLSPPAPPVAAQDRPADLVKTAVAAAGGAEVLAKYPAGRVAGKGTMTFAGAETPFTFEQAYHLPGRFRTVIRCEPKGQKWELVQVVSEKTAAQTINGKAVPLTDAGLEELRLAVLLNEVGLLTPLLNERRFTLKPDRQQKGPDLAGVVVHAKHVPDLRLGFDRKTGHLVRVAYKQTDPDAAKEAETENAFSDFKEVSGLTRPTRCVVTRDGKKVAEVVVETFTPLERIDPKVFVLEE